MNTPGTATILRAKLRNRQAIALTIASLSTIVATNWAVQHLPVAHLTSWLIVPAGAWTAGLALCIRDFLSKHGRGWVWAAIGLGTVLSLLIAGPGLAAPSAAAFLFAELADWWVWVRLERRHPYWAVTLSNSAGSGVDTEIFLGLAVLAFHIPYLSMSMAPGQLVGKLATTIPALAILWAIRRRQAHAAHRELAVAA